MDLDAFDACCNLQIPGQPAQYNPVLKRLGKINNAEVNVADTIVSSNLHFYMPYFVGVSLQLSLSLLKKHAIVLQICGSCPQRSIDMCAIVNRRISVDTLYGNVNISHIGP